MAQKNHIKEFIVYIVSQFIEGAILGAALLYAVFKRLQGSNN